MGDVSQTIGLGMIGGEEGPQLKKQKVEDEAAAAEEEASLGTDDDSISDDERVTGIYDSKIEKDPELRELFRRYNEAVEKSNGFDTVELPRCMYFGVVYPINFATSDWTELVMECAEYAVQEYNIGRTKPYRKLSAGQEAGDLVLHKVIKANLSGCGGVIFYITLDALNTLSGRIFVFQAKVYSGPADDDKEVLIFRPKPVGSM